MARGIQTAVDSLDFFVQSRDATVLTVTATATSTQTSADQQQTLQRGAILNPVFSTISATCTVRITVQGKDDISGIYYAITSVSFDGLTTGNTNVMITSMPWKIYPGYTGTPLIGTAINDFLPAKFRVIASITGATTSLAAVSFKVNACKVM